MSVEINGKKYTGVKAVVYSIPILAFIGFAFLMIGIVMTSPIWILALFLSGLS